MAIWKNQIEQEYKKLKGANKSRFPSFKVKSITGITIEKVKEGVFVNSPILMILNKALVSE